MRKIVLNETLKLHTLTEILLFEASRAQYVKNILKPQLEKGINVITDRYCHSTIAFQGFGRGYDLEAIYKLNEFAIQKVYPDITFIFDVEDIDAAVKRALSISQRLGEIDKFEHFGIDFNTRVRDGYRKIVESKPFENEKIILVPHFEDQEINISKRINIISKYVSDYLDNIVKKRL